jgi:hypothetical protein
MNGFSLRKWYCDLLTPQHEFVFVYIARAAFGRAAHTSLNIAVASLKDGPAIIRSRTLRNSSLPEESGCWSLQKDFGRISAAPSGTDIDLQIDELRVFAAHRHPRDADTGLGSLAIRQGPHHMMWRPLALGTRVSGKVCTNRREFQFTDAGGYLDFVYSDFFPYRMPGRQVLWGRLHCEEVDLAYTRILGRNAGECWRQLVVRTAESTHCTSQFDLRLAEERESPELKLRHPHRYELAADFGAFRLSLTVEHIAPLVASDFLKEQPLRNRLVRGLLAWVARHPRGIKFLSRGTLRLERLHCLRVLRTEFLIDEHVEFQ